MNTRRIAAIPTTYAGCRFRSRAEARWCCFFDAMGWAWDYEPEGYRTRGGYLPDFLLRHPTGNRWFEVKPYIGPLAKTPEDARWAELATGTGLPVHVAYGMHRPGDGCGARGKPSRHATRAILPGGSNLLLEAYWTESVHDRGWAAGNGARFEHGESGWKA